MSLSILLNSFLGYQSTSASSNCVLPLTRKQCIYIYSSEEETELTGPPQYDATYLVNESPPVYEDALQDIVIAAGKNEVFNSLADIMSYSLFIFRY